MLRFVLAAAFAACLAAATPAAAQGQPFAIDHEHSWVTFRLDHLGFTQAVGTLGNVRGEVVFDEAEMTRSSVSATIDVTTVNSQLPARDNWIRSERMLDVTNHPTMRFVSTRIERTGANTGRLHGELTLRGQTRPVVLDATFNRAATNPLNRRPTLGFTATTTIRRAEFGLNIFPQFLGDEVQITINLEAMRAPPG